MATTSSPPPPPSPLTNDDRMDDRHSVEDDYIDMDLNSLCYTTSCSSPQHPLDFEFHMTTNHFTSTADDLFSDGKLLPLHLVDRLEKTIVITTPFLSCNVSPSTSCFVSGELNPDDYFHHCHDPSEPMKPQTRKHSWSKRLRLSRTSGIIGSKLKASKAFLKSIFNKSTAATEAEAVSASVDKKVSQAQTKVVVVGKKKAFGQIYAEKTVEKDCHRRSFSGAIKWQSSCSVSTSCSSSNSSSFSSEGSSEGRGQAVLKRSSSAGSDGEGSIQGAIAYCKKSQQTTRKVSTKWQESCQVGKC